ncbi:MAG: C69 family dipeptidase [Ignavibacteria bacterium]|jgi:dipeptidase|nr:C69 family dipeptidase [Ignavibacteria bacterium]
MKKTISLVFLIVAFINGSVYPCTNFLVTRGASTDGSTFITYTADSHTLYGELYFWPAMNYPPGTMMDVIEWDSQRFLCQIPQVEHTYNVVGNMNEFQLAIGETTYGGREELVDTTGKIDYGSLIYIALQRAKNCREAIKVMTGLVEEYGYCSSGESFSLSDPNEVWIMEMIGKGPGNKGAVWVAVRIPDGYVSGHANHARIQQFPLNDTMNCYYSKDVISFAKQKGYYKGDDEKFSFSDAYAPVDFGAARFCEARVWSLFNKVASGMSKYTDYAKGENLKNRMPLYVKPDKKISVYDVMTYMRDHYQGTELDMTKDWGAGPYVCPVRWRPLTFKVGDKTYFNERAISTQQTGFSFVTQSRSWLPDAIGGIFWFGVDDNYTSVYTPMYTSIKQVPPSLAVGNGDMMVFSDSSAFWIFNQVSNFAYTRYKDMIQDIQPVQKDLEQGYLSSIADVDAKAKELYEQDPEQAKQFLTEYCLAAGKKTFDTWKKLYGFLFTKYMDGNIKFPVDGSRVPKVSQPGYSQDWYKELVKQTGDRFKVKGDAGH